MQNNSISGPNPEVNLCSSSYKIVGSGSNYVTVALILPMPAHS